MTLKDFGILVVGIIVIFFIIVAGAIIYTHTQAFAKAFPIVGVIILAFLIFVLWRISLYKNPKNVTKN